MSGKASGQKVWTPSNVITVTRILLVPVFVAALLAPWPEWFGLSWLDGDWKNFVAAAIFVIISATDWLDGYLARSRGEVTDFGKFMDPLADKILVCAALISLVELGVLPTWVVLIILAREFIVSGVRMMAASKGVVIAASMIGKFKTVFQMAAIVLFTIKDTHAVGTLGDAFSDFMWDASWLVMLVALGLTIASMFDYLYKGRDLFGFGRQGADGPGERAYQVEDLAQRAIGEALAANITLSSAESLTGGYIGAALTSVPGSSGAYLGGVVSYTDGVKRALLDVSGETLSEEGAVSRATAQQMAEGARAAVGADIAVSVTGIAGPGGAERGKPVGTVWMGVSTARGTRAQLFHFEGDRDEVRRQTVLRALEAYLEEISRQSATS